MCKRTRIHSSTCALANKGLKMCMHYCTPPPKHKHTGAQTHKHTHTHTHTHNQDKHTHARTSQSSQTTLKDRQRAMLAFYFCTSGASQSGLAHSDQTMTSSGVLMKRSPASSALDVFPSSHSSSLDRLSLSLVRSELVSRCRVGCVPALVQCFTLHFPASLPALPHTALSVVQSDGVISTRTAECDTQPGFHQAQALSSTQLDHVFRL